MSRRRQPTGEELELWEKVTETVAPLERPRPKSPPKAKPSPAGHSPPSKLTKAAKPKPASLPPKLQPKPPAPPALNPFDRRTLSRIGRGTVAIDARIDLHGMTQEAAEARLVRFLADAQARQAKLVLVITGKGKPGTAGEERGVLRRVVPHWLSSPKLRPMVVGFDAAGPSHGGSGALYVRIRRAGRAARG
jgi:DNA-nicking Smr family endonuclease